MPKPPRRKTEWKDQYTLLCERCGYIIEDLDHALPCPECGKPISESLPKRRVGTPWQQKPGIKSIWQTWWMTIRHPIHTLDVMRVAQTNHLLRASQSIVLTQVIACISLVATTTIISSNPLQSFSPLQSFISIIPALILALTTSSFFLLLTWIEQRGLVIIGRTRRFRITQDAAWTIVTHGTVGWLLLSCFLYVSLGTALFLIHDVDSYNEQLIFSDDTLQTIAVSSLLLSIPGFLFFETFAYLGLRRCKYANRPRPTDQPQP